METLNRRLGARMKALRRLAGFSRSELARATGRPAGQIRDYEAGVREMDAAAVWEISGALHVPVETLFELDDPCQGQRPFPEKYH